MAEIIIVQTFTYLQAFKSYQETDVQPHIIRTTTATICKPCYPRHNWPSAPYWKDWESFWFFQWCTEWWKQWEQCELQLYSTRFQDKHSKFCVPIWCSCFTELFEVVCGMTCWIFASQKCSVLTVQGNIHCPSINQLSHYPLEENAAKHFRAGRSVCIVLPSEWARLSVSTLHFFQKLINSPTCRGSFPCSRLSNIPTA